MPDKVVLRNLMERVAHAASLPEVYSCALTCLQDTLEVERSSLLVFDENKVMRFVAWTGLSDRYRAAVDGHSPWKPGDASAEPLLVSNARDDPGCADYRAILESEDIRALAFIPLRFGGRVLGKFMLYYREPHEFTEEEIVIAEIVAGYVAFALERFRTARELEERLAREQQLAKAAEDARAAAERARSRLQTLAELHDDLASSLEPDAALRLLAKRLATRTADYCFTYAFDGRSIRRVGMAHRDPEKKRYVEALAAADPPTLYDDWGVGPVIRSGEPMITANVTQELFEKSLQSKSQRDALRQLRPRSILLAPLKARGRTVGAIALVTDASSTHGFEPGDLELARELASHAALLIDNSRLYTEATSAIRARDDMIAVVSHDLRNPLQSIASAAAVLQHDETGERRAASAGAIRVATEQMERLLQDLLDITQIDAGQLFVKREKIEVEFLMGEARTMFQELARERSIDLQCSVAPGLPPIRVDRDRILQVLSNLLGNALKFVPSGGRIELSATEDAGRVRIAVTDTGPGIEEKNLPKVFERFWRADRRKERGAGLGLAVAKGIVEAHGGDIGVESRKGHGSSFYFLLDAGTPSTPEASRPAGLGPILVVDDDKPFRDEIVEVLRDSGYDVVSAGDSREALEYLASETPPSLVILDGLTPLMDGRRLYEAVKDVPQLESVPMILSSNLRNLELDEVLHGAAYLDKPVRPSQLLGLAAALCHRTGPSRHLN
ncbi:MAG TPA: ATP-binding protein [Woeseiaceae bacterium]|nr:ATP-binding protein [Woeseiaceae bacterium]